MCTSNRMLQTFNAEDVLILEKLMKYFSYQVVSVMVHFIKINLSNTLS